MTAITFVESNGKKHVVEAQQGESAMRAATQNDIPGIFADCGGAMTCATCHVYLDLASLELAGPASAEEEAILEMAVDPQPNSRLACQIIIEEHLAGLVIDIPASQF